MKKDFVQISGKNFVVNDVPVRLRGYALGSWMNLEHFMIGFPGTNSMIQDAFADVYGSENARLFFDSFLEKFITEDDIVFLKDMGTNSIRIPFGYHYFIDDRNPGMFLERGFNILDRVVKLCEKHEMYVILDLHSVPGSQNNDWHSDNLTGQSLFWKYRCFQEQTAALWREIASRYSDNPWIAGYDVLNEPGYGLTKDEFNGFYQMVVSAIRETDKHHIIFLEGDDFGRSFNLFNGEPEDPQITYVVHFYPFVLEEDILSPELDEAKRIKIYETIFYRQLKELEHFNRPIWCGESGYNLLEEQEAFYSKLIRMNIDLCENNNMSWSLWTYKDARRMGIVIPREDSPWMRLRRRIEENWSHEWEQETSMKIIKEIGEKFFKPMDEKLLYDLDFRVRSIMHRIAVEQILKPRLSEIPWNEMKNYPDSFLYGNCDKRGVIIKDVKNLIDKENENEK